MGILDFLKKRKDEIEAASRTPQPISNEEYQRKRLAEINALERKYDLSSVEGIMNIPVPKKKAAPDSGVSSPTSKIEYNLLLRAGQYKKDGQVDMALACYRKANELMPYSSTEYGREPYMRLPRYLRELRRFDEARWEEARIAQLFASGFVFDYGGDDPETARKRAEYDWLWEFVPDICPKTFAGYSRMKKANTENYQKIVAAAAKLGYKIK